MTGDTEQSNTAGSRRTVANLLVVTYCLGVLPFLYIAFQVMFDLLETQVPLPIGILGFSLAVGFVILTLYIVLGLVSIRREIG